MAGRPATQNAGGFRSRRTYGNAAAEFCAEFRRTAEDVITKQPSSRGRLKLWTAYYVDGRPFTQARISVGVSPSTFAYWSKEIAWSTGAALRKRRIKPPGGYFFWLIQGEQQ